jgi:Cu+-exporting ATPase
MGFQDLAKGKSAMKHQRTAASHNATVAGAIDPVCGMTVDIASAKYKAEYKGIRITFCSAGCKTKFVILRQNIWMRMSGPRADGCWHHLYLSDASEIRQEGPGSCPICGMALEPLTVTAEERPKS